MVLLLSKSRLDLPKAAACFGSEVSIDANESFFSGKLAATDEDSPLPGNPDQNHGKGNPPFPCCGPDLDQTTHIHGFCLRTSNNSLQACQGQSHN